MIEIIKKMYRILTSTERRKLYIIFVLMTVSALIEVAGVASIMPFLSVVTNPGSIQQDKLLSFLYTTFNFQNTNRFLVFVGILVLAILIVGNLLKSLKMWGMYRFTGGQNFRISKRLLNSYIYRPYVFFLDKNTADLGKNILSEVQQVVNGIMFPLMHIVSRGIVAVLIFILLFMTDALLSVIVIVILGGAYSIVYKIIKQKMDRRGKLRFNANTSKFKVVSEAFGGIKQLKIMRCEDIFLSRYSKYSSEFEKHRASFNTISEIPHYLMELVAFGGIMIIVLYLIVSGTGLETAIPVIGLYAFALRRLMPSLQGIFRQVTTIRFNAHAMNTLYEDLKSSAEKEKDKLLTEDNQEPLPIRNVLKLENITFSYPNTKRPVIKNLNLEINVESSIAFAGKTGVGKTTIVDIILGLLRPQSGNIFVDDNEITDENLSNWQQNLGYIPQDIYLQDDTVASNIAFGMPKKEVDRDKIRVAAKIANIHNFVTKELSEGYDTLIGERGIRLSGGQKQRIGIARALYRDPEVLVLDEATSDLDGATEAAVLEAINNIGEAKTLIMIAHRLTTVKNCDVIYLLDNGKIIDSGTYDELLKNNDQFKRMARQED
ncbi:MAG: ABC transporter ATP-binding protein [Elusimicrobiota bacterium]